MNSTALKVIKNEAMTMTDKRSLNTITAEIVTITRQVGRRLCEAKEQVAHGGRGE